MVEDKKAADGAQVTSRDTIYTGNVFSFVSEDIVLAGTQTVLRREFIDHPGAVAIVAIRPTPRGPEVLLQSQYRHPIRTVLWEIPAGLLDAEGEDPLDAAKRELAEEAGLSAGRWDVLLDLFSTPGAINESLRVYLARDLGTSTLDYERTEEEAGMVPAWVPIDEAVTLALTGAIHNSTTIAGIFAAHAVLGGHPARDVSAPWLR